MSEVVKVTIDEDECSSCEACVSECEQVFEMAEDKVVVKPAAKNPAFLKQHSEGIIAAAEVCPCEAIKVETT